jgi:glycerol-3-phosphate dehydrogenase (NAD(P)+)
MKNLAIIGAGNWGTALAIRLAPSADRIGLWVYEPELVESLSKTRSNDLYLPGAFIPENVQPTGDMGAAVAGADIVLSVIPSQHVRSVYRKLACVLDAPSDAGRIFVSATKGLESETLMRMSEVIQETLAHRFPPRVAVLSGPTFAREIVRGSPAAVVIASSDEDLARLLQKRFSSSSFRLYTNTDVIGVEIGGAVKNVIAIAAGVCEGMGLGSNAIAALITRGLSEMTRLACACGARRETLTGLAGLGDLVLTCTGALSRNRTVGVELGRGHPLPKILESMRMVAEGIKTTEATLQLARKKGVEMPITEQMYALLYHGRSPQDTVRELMERTLKPE